MTDASSRKEGFKKCRSATFSIDGYSFTIGENFPPLSDLRLGQALFLVVAVRVFSKRGIWGWPEVRQGRQALARSLGSSVRAGEVLRVARRCDWGSRDAPAAALTPHPWEAASLKGSVPLLWF